MNTRSRHPLLLFELVIALLVFALAAGLLVRAFALAHETARQTLEDTRALSYAEDVIERFSASELDAGEYLAGEGFSSSGGEYRIVCDYPNGDVEFTAELRTEKTSAGRLEGFMLTASGAGREIFTLEAARYDAEEAAT